MSASVVWDVICRSDSFRVKSHGTVLSRDPRNVTGVHSFKNSGLAQAKFAGVTTSKETGYVLTVDAKTSIKLEKKRTAAFKQIIDATASRPDLRKAALAKSGALRRSKGVHPVINHGNAEAGRALRQRKSPAAAASAAAAGGAAGGDDDMPDLA